MPAPLYPCNGTDRDGSNPCDQLVRARRPSESGMHWCSHPKCQAAKQRWIRAQRRQRLEELSERTAEDAKNLTPDAMSELLLFVSNLATRDRVECPTCSHPAAVPGFMHPRGTPEDPTGANSVTATPPCFAVGNRGALIGPLGILRAAFPRKGEGSQS